MKATQPGTAGADASGMDPVDASISDDLARMLQDRHCDRVLIIHRPAASDESLKRLLQRPSSPPHTRIIDPAEWLKQDCARPRYPVGIVWDSPAVLPNERYTRLLARLRDLDCEAVYVRCRTESCRFSSWSQYLRSLGFMPLKNYAGKTALFYFDIYDYKHVPDWLNSTFWANPEMWNKARW